jgi:hypothetical protein
MSHRHYGLNELYTETPDYSNEWSLTKVRLDDVNMYHVTLHMNSNEQEVTDQQILIVKMISEWSDNTQLSNYEEFNRTGLLCSL